MLLGDGSSKPISEIQVGDEVLATDPATGESGPREVTQLWIHQDELIDLKIGENYLTTTEDHRFWNETDQEWQRAEALDVGDKLRTPDGKTATVYGLRPATRHIAAAYNLTVAELHTYYVIAGDTPVLVHNDDDVIYYRGIRPDSDDHPFYARDNDIPVDKKTGFVKEGLGLSLDTDPEWLRARGMDPVPFDMSTLPDNMRVIRQGQRDTHYVIAPKEGADIKPADYRAATEGMRTTTC
ncbi:polymorphic toxin-type HINT domain-containing protein [Catellatospora citrea]|uniref:polymorphic toxin-type HINT domain-containing protein n=1 Tax=Catellatospora citrea TaxID=53366 RepID=UPI002699EE9F|nr:polymorphic toxin-type HINT domain-containing protein [Catellatospora citrea]